MADKTIKVKVDVETNVEPSIAALKSLKKQLKETAAGSEDFQRLQQQINDTEDAIKSAKTGASNFTEVLGQLPGPIGDIGNKVSGAVNTLKQFSGLKLTDIKASFVELGKDLVDVVKGFGQLTGITKAYTSLNNFLAASFVKVGLAEGAAAVGAKALSAALISTGIGALVVLLGSAVSALMDYFDASKKAEKAADDYSDAIKRQNELLAANLGQIDFENKKKLLQAQIAGKSEKELSKIQQDGLTERYNKIKESNSAALQEQKDLANKQGKYAKISDEQRAKLLEKNLENLQKLGKDESDAREAIEINKLEIESKAAEKTRQNTSKNNSASISAAERKKEELKKIREQELAAIVKGEEDAFKATLSERERTEYEINQKYSALVASAVKYNQDTTILEAGRQAELKTMTDKFATEDAEKKKELDEKEAERLKKKGEDERGIILLGLQTKLETLDAENQKIDGDFEQDLERLAEQREILAEQEATELQNTELTEFQKTEIRKKYADARKGISDQEIATEKAAQQAKHDINMAYLQLFEQFGNVLGQVAGKNKALAIAGVVISQAASIGQIIANTGIANAKAVAANPLGFGQPWVTINTISAGLSIASAVASAAKSIQQINSAASQAGVTGGGGGSAPGATSTIPAPVVGSAAAPQIQTGGGQNPTAQIGQTISAAQKPIKAYVVSGEISSQQALDRRTSVAATFTGG
jgi:hypothetical protein